MSKLLAHIKVIVAVAIALFLGRLVAHFVGGLPASLYGMMIFAGIFLLGLIDANEAGKVIETYLSYSSLVFIPVCVGIIGYGDLFVSEGWKILLIGVTVVLFIMACLTKLTVALFKRGDHG